MAAEDRSPSTVVVNSSTVDDGQLVSMDAAAKKSPEEPPPSSPPPPNIVKDRGCCHVDVELIPLKAHYFFFFGALSSAIVPMILYCQQLGMSLSMVGLLFGVLPFVQLISKPVSGVITDKIGKHKSVFIFNLIVLAVSLFSTNFIPKVKSPTTLSSSDDDEARVVRWRPEESASVECFANGPFQLRTCDYLHDNESTLSLQLLATATVGCNLTCGPTQFEAIQRLFCDPGHPHCLLRSSKYSFYDTFGNRNHINMMVSIDPAPNAGVRLSPHLSNTDLFCTTLAVSNVSVTDVLFPTMHLHVATTASCPSSVRSVFECPGVCKTSYESTTSSSSVAASQRPSNGNGTSEAVPKDDLTLQFVWIWIACIIGWAAYGAALSTADTILIVTLGEARRGDYGKTRVFSSLGWGIVSPLSAYLIDLASEGKALRDFSPGFYVFFVLMVVNIFVVFQMSTPHTEKPRRLAADVIQLFATPRVLLFATAVFAIGITTGFLWCFLVVYIVGDLQGSQLIIGLNYAVECLVSEVPLFVASGWIVDRIGYAHSMTFVLFVGAFKCLVYSVIVNAWYMLVVALVHGVMYGLLYATLASYAAAIAPPGATTTLQGIFQGIFEGAGVGIGTVIGGVVYERIGGRQTFFVFGAATMVACVAHFVLNYLLSGAVRDKKVQVSKTSKDGSIANTTF